MPRTSRASVGGVAYHVINRGNGCATVFHADGDYAAFTRLIGEACERLPLRVLAYCLMPNHFHLVLWPHGDGDLSRWMQWFLTAHVRRYHSLRGTSGHVWQGRFKAFPIEQDEHLLTVIRYVERNPLRGRLVRRAENWPWSSRHADRRGRRADFLADWPISRPRNWTLRVNQSETAAELETVRGSVKRGAPYGDGSWAKEIAVRLGLESTLRPRGRPRKALKK